MRNIQISVSPRPGTNDNQFSFMTNSAQSNPNQESQVYEFLRANISYSIQTSKVTSKAVFSMNAPLGPTNIIRSGQLVIMTDGPDKIFEGQIIPRYINTPISQDGQGGLFLEATLIPSIYQLTTTPMVFDPTQVDQINSLLGVNLAAILVGATAQEVFVTEFLSYMISNTDYATSFKKTIKASGLPDKVFLMASAGQKRDDILRASLDYTNTVIYQQEDGTITIRPLSASVKAPFMLDLANTGFGQVNAGGQTKISMLNFEYEENGVLTPSVISNYALLPSNLGVIDDDVSALLVSYKPNPKYYPRVQQLQNTGWFVGDIANSQINQNIVSDPTVAAIVKGYQAQADQYMISSVQSGASQDFIASYQSLLSGKQLGAALTTYSSLNCGISLDDPYLPATGMGNILGSCVEIQNCDMQVGIIAGYTRSYSASGSFIALNIVPIGSITGYWTS